jgi:hypothetical protein
MPVAAQRGGGGVVRTHSQPKHLNEMGDQYHALTNVPPGKIQYSLKRRLDGPWGQSG